MPALNRMSGPRGPRFYDEEGNTLFVNILDASTRDGPRPAMKEDAEAHPKAWADYARRRQIEDDHEAATAEAHKAGKAAPPAPLGEFPGAPVVTVTDPPEGPPPELPSRRKMARDKAALERTAS